MVFQAVTLLHHRHHMESTNNVTVFYNINIVKICTCVTHWAPDIRNSMLIITVYNNVKFVLVIR